MKKLKIDSKTRRDRPVDRDRPVGQPCYILYNSSKLQDKFINVILESSLSLHLCKICKHLNKMRKL